jgi:hypothetical protein
MLLVIPGRNECGQLLTALNTGGREIAHLVREVEPWSNLSLIREYVMPERDENSGRRLWQIQFQLERAQMRQMESLPPG